MRSVSGAVVLILGDGLVAAGRVLGGLRRRCDTERRADALAVAEESREVWAPGELEKLWETPDERVPDGPSAFVWPESVGPKHGLTCRSCEGDIATCGCWDDDADESNPQCSAAVTVPAADNTTQADRLEAAFNYHKGAVGYAAMRAGGVEWFCEGCSWSGPTKQAHARHRFQVLADMKNATTRVQEQLGGAS